MRCALSVWQEQFLFHERLHAGAVNVVPLTLEVTGPLDLRRLHRAYADAVHGAPALGARIVQGAHAFEVCYEDGLQTPPMRVFAPLSDPADLMHPDHPMGCWLRAPLPLDAPPLTRAGVARLGPQRHLIGFSFHHIAFDGWSMRLFLDRLLRLYAGEAPPDPAAQRAWLMQQALRSPDSARRQVLLAYWREALGGAATGVSFPDLGGGSAQRARALAWTAQDAARLRKLSAAWRVTPFVVLSTLVSVVLHRHTLCDDFILGTPHAQRADPACADIIGCFVGALPLRVSLLREDSGGSLARRLRSTAWNALRHSDLPFQDIVRATRRLQADSTTGLFGTLVNLLPGWAPGLTPAGLTVRALRCIEPAPRYPMTVYAHAAGDDTFVHLAHDHARISPAYAAEISAQLRAALAEFAQSPDLRVQQVRLDPQAHQHWLARMGAPVDCDAASLPDLCERVARQAREWPDRPAIEQCGRALTFGALQQAVHVLAGRLVHAGLVRGATVLVRGERSPMLVACMLAVWHCGAVVLVADAETPAQRVEVLCEHAAVTLHLLPAVGAVTPDQVVLSGRGAGVHVSRPLDAAYLFFTSGTTAAPRAVLGRAGALAHFIAWQGARFGIGRDDRVASVTGLGFDVALRELFVAIAHGGTLVLPPAGMRPLERLDWLRDAAPTLLHVVPTVARAMLRRAVPALPSLRWTFFAGEPLDATLVAAWRARHGRAGAVANLYGPTETTLAKLAYCVPEPPLPGVQCVGLPQPGAQAYIECDGQPRTAAGELGQLVIRTPFRSAGYLGDADCAGRLQRNPLSGDSEDRIYLTGDLARRRIEGDFELCGRLDGTLKVRGQRVDTEAVARVLRAFPGVQDVAVLALQQDDEPVLAAFVCADSGVLEAAALRAFVAARVESHAVPARFAIVPEIPVTPNGKVDRRCLAEVLAAQAQSPERPWQPADALEHRLLALWGAVLRRADLDASRDFFANGGDSLSLLEVCERLARQEGVQLALEDLMAAPTVTAMAALVRRAAASTVPPMQDDAVRRAAARAAMRASRPHLAQGAR